MKRKFSVYHLVIAVLLFSLVLPGTILATERTTGTLTIHKYEQELGQNKVWVMERATKRLLELH
ncbi:hypothetical protein ACI2OX_15965 [Bacillus sp. N9]